MNPTVMLAILLAAIAAFAWTAGRRWQLMRIGLPEDRTDRLPERVASVVRFGLGQSRMPKYPIAGIAHFLIFAGFSVLLLRTVVLVGRGFDEGFDLWILGEGTTLGDLYSAIKDTFAVLVLAGASYFVYARLIAKPKRLTLSGEGLLILGIIMTMMVADLLYDGSELARTAPAEGVAWSWAAPVGTVMGKLLARSGLSDETLLVLGHAGYWTHVSLVLIFLNLLPLSKHFHIITALPNVFARDLTPRGRLRPIPDIEDRVGEDRPVGIRTIEDLSWKGILDLYTCTECGRCTDNCPANKTGKLLSPKHISLALRDHLYAREEELVDGRFAEAGQDPPPSPPSGERSIFIERSLVNLVPAVIAPEALWACTTCRACEEECPVFISYVDKIVDMRRDLVAYGKDMPPELQKPFDGMERNGNPWNFARIDRTGWTEGLEVKVLSEHPGAEVLFWVGCAASYDDRARKIARSLVRLFQLAGVDFAILGSEESCTGDPARRAGNEYLFQMLAAANVETLNGHGVKKIVTTCPHCFNTLANEYPDFGGKYEVVHHSVFLEDLLSRKKLVPTKAIAGKVVFHDSCYLGRYNDVYDPPRKILSSIPGLHLVEAHDAQGGSAHRERGLCCGAGGAQFWKEEEKGRTRVSTERTEQLLATGAGIVTSACPFCQTMLTDGIKAKDQEGLEQLDIVEILERSIDAAPATGL
jgi:Fe-S oxidoreductase